MQCKMCGHEFDSLKEKCVGGCGGCGGCKCGSKTICPNCGCVNSLCYEKEFDYISQLKSLLKIFAK